MRQRVLHNMLPPVVAAVVALGLISLVFAFIHITPFGDRSLLFSDFGTQYVPFATYLQAMMRHHIIPIYSFAQSLGDSFVPTLAYYLLSPFNLLLLPFKAAQVPVAMAVIIMAKVTAAAGSEAWYLQQHFGKRSWWVIVFGVAWALSSFVAANYYDLMWLDTLVWLPLMLLGLDGLIKRVRTGHYVFWLVLLIVTNYYLGYMSCLFAVVYFVYELSRERPQLDWRHWWRDRVIRQVGGRFIGASLAAGLMTMVVLIPTVLGMSQTAKTGLKWQDFVPLPLFGPGTLTQFGLGSQTYLNRLHHGPTLFAGSLVLLLVISFFFNQQIDRRAKKRAGWLLGVLGVSIWLRPFNTMWHMFKAPAGFPFRQSFVLVFVLIMLAYQTMLTDPRHNTKNVVRHWLPAVLAGGYLVAGGLGHLLKHYGLAQGGNAWYTSTTPWPNLLAASVAVLIVGYLLFATASRLMASGLVVVTLAELTGNFILLLQGSPLGSQSRYEAAFAPEQAETKATQLFDRHFYRISNENRLLNNAYPGPYNSYNDALLFNFYGVSGYNSTLSEPQRLFMQSLGMFSDNERRISAQGSTVVSATLLGVKYETSLTKAQKPVVHQALGYAGMGFLLDKAALQTKLDAASAQVNLQRAVEALSNQPSSVYFRRPQIDDIATIALGHGRYRHQVALQMSVAGQLYLYSLNGKIRYSATTVDGKAVRPQVLANGLPMVWPLGDFKHSQKVRLIYTDHQRSNSAVKATMHILARGQYARLVQRLKAHSFRSYMNYSGGQPWFKDTVVSPRSNQMLYLTIPAAAGWQATVNGRRVQPVKAFGVMMALPLSKGKNVIRVQYREPGLLLGALISMLSLLGYLGWRLWVHWRRQQGGSLDA